MTAAAGTAMTHRVRRVGAGESDLATPRTEAPPQRPPPTATNSALANAPCGNTAGGSEPVSAEGSSHNAGTLLLDRSTRADPPIAGCPAAAPSLPRAVTARPAALAEMSERQVAACRFSWLDWVCAGLRIVPRLVHRMPTPPKGKEERDESNVAGREARMLGKPDAESAASDQDWAL